jgi:hypothetical protein
MTFLSFSPAVCERESALQHAPHRSKSILVLIGEQRTAGRRQLAVACTVGWLDTVCSIRKIQMTPANVAANLSCPHLCFAHVQTFGVGEAMSLNVLRQ